MKSKKKIIILVVVIAIILITLLATGIFFGVKYVMEYIESNSEASVDEEGNLYAKYFNDKGRLEGIKAEDYIAIPDLNTIIVPEENKTVESSVVDSEIEYILSQYPNTKLIEDTNYVIKNGDIVNIDYVGSTDGVEFEGGSTQGMGTEVIIGETQYIDGFLDQLIGRKAGEIFDIQVTFPADYASTDLAGKNATFNITINGIYEESELVFNDEFVQANYGSQFQTAEEFRKDLEETIIKYSELDYILGQLVEKSTVIEYPQILIDYTKLSIEEQMEYDAENYGMTIDEYITAIGYTSFDEYYNSQIESNEQTMKVTLIYQSVAEMYNLEVTEEGIGEFFLENYGSSDWSHYQEIYSDEYIKHVVIQELVNSALVENI